MSADQQKYQPPASAAEPDTAQPNSRKVRSTRYDWAHETAPAQPADPSQPKKMAARRSLFRRLLDRLAQFLGGGRNPFDRDDDPDPMAA